MSVKLRWVQRRALALAVAALCVVALTGTALAGHQTSGVKSYTGCLVSGDGVIIKVKEGNSPRSACTGGQVEAHFSGGDITKISVGSGLSLPNGGDNGEVRIVLDASHSLPQGCTTGRVAKWNGSAWICGVDNDTTYTAGTGLDLSAANAFSIEPAYRVKNTPDCSSGQFATGFDGDGNVQCQSPAAQALPWVQASFEGGSIPDDGALHVFASVGVTPGTYLVVAKGAITSEENVDQFKNAQCRIDDGGFEVDVVFLSDDQLNDVPTTPFALTGIRTVTSGSLDLECRAGEGADGVGLRDGRIIAVRIG
jgi:hypothetical protein